MHSVDVLGNASLQEVSEVPTVDECIVHLRLLESFYNLRQETSVRNGLFGMHEDLYNALDDDDGKRQRKLAEIREKRWAVYVARAARRFEVWWHKCFPFTSFDQDWWKPDRVKSGPRLHVRSNQLPPLGKYLVEDVAVL